MLCGGRDNMNKKIFISIAIILIIFTIGYNNFNSYKKETKSEISTNTNYTKKYHEEFNEDERTWNISFEEFKDTIKKEISIENGDILNIIGKRNSGTISLIITQEGHDKDDKDISTVPMDGSNTKYAIFNDRWDLNKKLSLELTSKDAIQGYISISLTKQQ